MSKTTTYIVSNNTELENRNSEYKYTPGSSTFEIPFGDIDSGIKKIENPSAANGAVVTQVSSDNTNKKIIVTPGASVKTSGKSYNTVIKYNITYNQKDDKDNFITKVAYSKVIFAVSMLGNVSQCIMTAHNGKLRPDEYIGVHPEDNDLESLVTKKSLISNLKEFGSQVSSKIGSASALSINYNLNGGHWDEGFEPRYTFVNSTGYTAKAPKKLGYVFAGWNVYPASGTEGTEPAEADRLYSANATGAVIEVGTTQNITAYAQWTPIVYNVVFNDKDGNAIVNQNFTYGSNATASGIAKPDAAAGYEFTNNYKIIGLNDQEVVYDITKKLDRVYDLVKTDHETGIPTFTLTPIFAPKKYSISYNTDGGVLETNNPSDTYTYGTSFVLPTPIKPGYSFNGWTATNTSNNFVQQRVISPSDLVDISTSTLELKAVWTKNNYHFEFDTQGGILKDGTLIYVVPNATYTVDNPTREGYTFNGWSCESNKATCTKNNDNKSYTIKVKDKVDTDIILKANWKAVQVAVKIEYWYESLNTNRLPSETASLVNTIYNLSVTKPLEFGANKESAITGSELKVTNSNGVINIEGTTGVNNTVTETITPEAGFDFVNYSISDNSIVNANGTSVIKLYFSRKPVYYTVSDKYYNGTSATDAPESHVRQINSMTRISALYGQPITVNCYFGTNNPANGYIADKNSITKILTDLNNPTPFEFTYTRKEFLVKFDVNNTGTWKINDSNILGNIYSTTAKYGQEINLPVVTEDTSVNSSSWYKNGVSIEAEATAVTITEDTSFVRIVNDYTKYTIELSDKESGAWNYDSASISAGSSRSLTGLTINDFPYYLKPATKTGFSFVRWEYSLNNSTWSSLGSETISASIMKKANNNRLYVKAIFSIDEPKISEITVGANTSTNIPLNITKNDSTNAIYCLIHHENSEIEDTGLGPELLIRNGKYNLDPNGLANNDRVLITPARKEGSKIKDTGKPWYGTVKINNNTITLDLIPLYTTLSKDTDTTYVNATDKKAGLMSAEDKSKLNDIQPNATSTSATSSSDNFADTTSIKTSDDTTADANAKTTAYDIGTVTPAATGATFTFKGKDTQYGKASASKYGLVKLGNDEKLGDFDDGSNKTQIYPVKTTDDGKLGVYVPWTDAQALPVTRLAVSDTDNANSHSAVSSGPVYINTYDTKGTVKTHTGAISIEGTDGVTVTAENGGNIKISGHEKPAVLNNATTDGYLVPIPDNTDIANSTDAKNSTAKYLRADGSWYTPEDTKVNFTGYRYSLGLQSSPVTTNKATWPVKSLAAGTGMTLKCNSAGELTIIGPASGRAAKAGTGLTEDDSKSTTERYLNLKGATFDTVSGGNVISGLGGIKIGTGGSKQFNYTWNNPGEAEPGWSASTTDIPVTIYQPNRANGKYYPVECTKDSAAVVCIPNVPSPFYDNTSKTIYVDSSSLRELKMFYKQPVRAESVNSNIQWVANYEEDGSHIFSETMPANPVPSTVGEENYVYESTGVESCIFPIIHFPSTVIFAELQAVSSEGGVLSAKLKEQSGNLVIDTSDIGCSVFPGFEGDSIKAGKPAYAYLRFTTDDQYDGTIKIAEGHTYNATIKISYKAGKGGQGGSYTSNIII